MFLFFICLTECDVGQDNDNYLIYIDYISSQPVVYHFCFSVSEQSFGTVDHYRHFVTNFGTRRMLQMSKPNQNYNFLSNGTLKATSKCTGFLLTNKARYGHCYVNKITFYFHFIHNLFSISHLLFGKFTILL